MTKATETADKAQAMLGDATNQAQAAMDKGARFVEQLNEFGKGNVEAMVESSKIAAKGLEGMGKHNADYAKGAFEHASRTIQSLATVKSPTEFMKLQSDYMRTAFDSLVAEASRSTEAMLKLAGEVAQPLQNRMAVAADQLKLAA